MLHIRVVKTNSGASAVQVIRYEKRKRIILKHIGSAHTENEILGLRKIAEQVVLDFNRQLLLFSDLQHSKILDLSQCEFLGVHHTFFYEIILELFDELGLKGIGDSLFRDLIIIRILEPASKLRSIELLETYFGIKHRRQNYYKVAPSWFLLKEKVEYRITEFAQKQYHFNFDMLFYDVTTLYFETFEADELRKPGFSKDGKLQRPQILVALLVTKESFPINYEIFAGNTFEGNTIIPVIQAFIKKHNVQDFTVIADAAMISTTNVEELQKHKINYIVGARLGNISTALLEQIDQQLAREDGKNIRINTPNGYLICSYSSLRYRKDKYEMEKQIQKAKLVIEKPSKNKKVKFTTSKDEKITLNSSLIDKTKKLLGVKGYYTDLNEKIATNNLIIERYHELYKIEQTFRISKNDLQTRPIFHFKEEPIKLHLLMSFIALVISKNIELKTNTSIKRFITDCKKITDARMLNKLTNKEIKIRTPINPKIMEYISKLNLSH